MNPRYFDFEISREFTCSPAILFEAWAGRETKARWFIRPKGWAETSRTVDLREVGTETMTGKFDGKMTTEYTVHFYDVQANQRIGYSFEVRTGGAMYSILTAVIEFIETRKGVSTKFHEQLAAFSGETVEQARPNRIVGTDSHFERLAEYLGENGNGSPEPFYGTSAKAEKTADRNGN